MRKKHYLLFYQEGARLFTKLHSICAKDFIMWKAFRTWEDGFFGFGNYEHKLFSEYLESINEQPYQRNTLDVAMAELVRSKLIIRGKSRGDYYLNPEFIWVGRTADRLQAIKKIKELEKIKEETVA